MSIDLRALYPRFTFADELQNEPYTFTHYLFLTRTYRLTAEEAAALEAPQRPSKRQKNKPQTAPSSDGGPSTYSFHAEDEYIQKVRHTPLPRRSRRMLTWHARIVNPQLALYSVDYSLTSSQPRDAESFGLDVAGRIMLVPAERFPELVENMVEAYAVPP